MKYNAEKRFVCVFIYMYALSERIPKTADLFLPIDNLYARWFLFDYRWYKCHTNVAHADANQ